MMSTMSDCWYGWHFLPDDRRLRWGSHEVVEAGRTYRVEGPLVLCAHGMHASAHALDALSYAPGPVVCRAPWKVFHLQAGGEVRPCCTLRKYMGNLSRQSFWSMVALAMKNTATTATQDMPVPASVKPVTAKKLARIQTDKRRDLTQALTVITSFLMLEMCYEPE